MSEQIKCPICYKTYKNYRSYHRHKTTIHPEAIQHVKDREIIYNKNPKYCNHCNAIIPYNKRATIFCNSSCSAKHHHTTRDYVNLIQTWRSKLGTINRDIPKYCKVRFSICDTCSTSYVVKRGMNVTYCSKRCNPEFYTKQSYRTQCKFKLSPAQQPELFNTTLILTYGWYVPTNHQNTTNLGGVCWDHLYRISEGYDNKIDPKIMAHPANAELVPWPINLSRKRSMISYDQLLERITSWDSGDRNLQTFFSI